MFLHVDDNTDIDEDGLDEGDDKKFTPTPTSHTAKECRICFRNEEKFVDYR